MSHRALRTPPVDVFLSHAPVNRLMAEPITHQLEAASCRVFTSNDRPAKDLYGRTTRLALWESVAFLAYVTRSHAYSDTLAFEIGAARGIGTPIFLVTDGIDLVDLMGYQKKLRRVTLDKLPTVVDAVAGLLQPPPERERAALAAAYRHLGYRVDDFVGNASACAALANEFALATGRSVEAASLVRELLRMRKRGELPRRRPAKTTQS